MDNLLSAHYGNIKIDAILSPYDGISIGVLSSLKAVGYGTADQKMPIVTGQDAELPSIKSILAGEQTQTVFKDTRELAKKAVAMADAVLKGKEAVVNDTKTYNNGVKVIPSFLLDPVSVDKTNYEKVLVGSGYYTKDELVN
jgi:putative multiple sugar transport system substrate-binding protein